MTMHRAKGLEFRKVLLFDVSEASIPRVLRDMDYSDAERSDALLRERSLAVRGRDPCPRPARHLLEWAEEPAAGGDYGVGATCAPTRRASMAFRIRYVCG